MRQFTYFKPPPRYLRTAVLLCALTLLSACSLIGTVYQSLPNLAIYQLSSYLDLTSEQYDTSTPAIAAVYQWHRKNELPLIVAQLRMAAKLTDTGVSSEQVQQQFDSSMAALMRLLEHSKPQQRLLLTALKPDNLTALEKKLNQENTNFRKDWIEANLASVQEKRFESFMRAIERIYGSYDAEQRRQLRTASDARVLRMDWVLEERVTRQKMLLDLMRLQLIKPVTHDTFLRARNAYMASFQKASSPERQQYLEQSRKQLFALISLATRIATPAQRLEARITLNNYANTLQDISEQP